jgi:hypothetical protein
MTPIYQKEMILMRIEFVKTKNNLILRSIKSPGDSV